MNSSCLHKTAQTFWHFHPHIFCVYHKPMVVFGSIFCCCKIGVSHEWGFLCGQTLRKLLHYLWAAFCQNAERLLSIHAWVFTSSFDIAITSLLLELTLSFFLPGWSDSVFLSSSFYPNLFWTQMSVVLRIAVRRIGVCESLLLQYYKGKYVQITCNYADWACCWMLFVFWWP